MIAFTATSDTVFDFTDQIGTTANNTKLFKYTGKLYAIHSHGDQFITEKSDDTTNPIQVSVATNQDLSSWADVSSSAPFSTLTDHVFEIEKFFTFKKYIYAFVVTTENTPELWRLRKKRDGAVWEQIGEDVFSTQLIDFTSAVVRLATVNVNPALFVIGHTVNGNHIYKTTDGVHWQRVNANALFVGDGTAPIVRLVKHTVDDTRYAYAFTQDGQVLRAELDHMDTWENVFTIQAVSSDADTPNPDFTLTSAGQIGGKLYVIGQAENDEPGGQLFVSTDWETASLTQSFNNSSGNWIFHKFASNNTLYILADVNEGMAWFARMTDNNTTETLLLSDVDFDHDESAQFTSLLTYKDRNYFSYRTSNGSLIYSLSE
ncbi:MAG: hypothetical protein HYV32_02405 [Candidatus Kerfeldbacteria bacterium]|nr:hypothetical protein [Candidatus Kerfeldbacteria bacterium]